MRSERTAALLAVVGAFVVVGVFFLHPYVVHGIDYPLGGSTPKNVAKVAWVGERGLEMVGTIRTGGALLAAVLMQATGQNALTILAVIPAVLAAMVGLGVAAMLRVAFGIRGRWLPVIALLTWVAFGTSVILSLPRGEGPGRVRFDNLVAVAAILPGLAAALAFAARRRGAVAVALLFAAAGFAHWPFFAFALSVAAGGVLAYVVFPWGAGESTMWARLREMVPLGLAGMASVAFVGLTFLARPATGWLGLRALGQLGRRLQMRLALALSDPYIYLPIPLALVGALGAARSPAPAGDAAGRRLFVAVVSVWVGITLAAIAASLVGIPTAGFRLIGFLFPITILTSLAVWWGARRLAARLPGTTGRVAGALFVAAVVGAFGTLSADVGSQPSSHIDAAAMEQTTSAGRYLAGVPRHRRAIFALDRDVSRGVLGFQVIQAALPPAEIPRSLGFFGDPERLVTSPPGIARRPLQFGPATREVGPDPVALLIERYHPAAFQRLAAESPERVVAPGVFVLRGPAPASPIPPEPPAGANTGAAGLLLVTVLLVALLLVSGGGWAIALLPPDALVRTALAPALGAATVMLGALVWERLGFPFSGATQVLPLAVITAAGWGLALAVRRRALRAERAGD